MIDEAWLNSLDFAGVHGLHIKGLAGLGSEKVVFRASAADGKELVLKTYRHHLGYHIKEIPLHLSDKPMYDVERVNKKLLRLVGRIQQPVISPNPRTDQVLVEVGESPGQKGIRLWAPTRNDYGQEGRFEVRQDCPCFTEVGPDPVLEGFTALN